MVERGEHDELQVEVDRSHERKADRAEQGDIADDQGQGLDHRLDIAAALRGVGLGVGVILRHGLGAVAHAQ
ncbi:hypothetical protein D3C86_2235370 [compost metagenome]